MTATAKDLVVAPIESRVSRDFVCKHHYSGKVTNNAQLHFGVFIKGTLLGAMQFGPPLDRAKVLGLVKDSAWNSMLELNRLVFLDDLPRNSESRALGVAMRMFKKHRPDIEWILSFADGTQCGDGTIYRASGFLLTQIKPSKSLARFPDGVVRHQIAFQNNVTRPQSFLGGRSYADITGGVYDWPGFCEKVGAVIVPGFQLRYIRFLNDAARARLTVPVLPFEAIDEAGARMYRGVRPPAGSPGAQPGGGG